PALAGLAELPRRGEQLGERRAGPRHRLAVEVVQLRLVVEGVHVRRRPFHAQEDDVPGPSREARRPGGQRVVLLGGPGREAGEGEVAEAHRGTLQGGTARERICDRVHGLISSHGAQPVGLADLTLTGVRTPRWRTAPGTAPPTSSGATVS